MFERGSLQPDAPALIDLSGPGSAGAPRQISWNQVAARMTKLANLLLDHGFAEETRLAVLGDTPQTPS